MMKLFMSNRKLKRSYDQLKSMLDKSDIDLPLEEEGESEIV